jgi:hypothetical protein
MGATVSYQLIADKVARSPPPSAATQKGAPGKELGPLERKGALGLGRRYRVGAGALCWGEGMPDPSDRARGPGDSEANQYDLKDLPAEGTEAGRYLGQPVGLA